MTNYVYTIKNIHIMKNLIVTILTILTTTISVLSQDNVWVKIPNYESKRTEVLNSISDLSITEIKKAFPSSHNSELQQVYQINCNCDVNELLVRTSKNNNFVKPELGPEYKTLDTPNDISVFMYDYALNSINAEQAWDITHGDTSVVIAITDANYYHNHEDLGGKITYRTIDNYSTDYTHGTAVAITAAGNTNNFAGKSSIGYNSKLQLRVMDYNELLEATYSGARVINASWASSCYFNYYAQQVINEVHNNGSVIIAAAGNGSTCGGSVNEVYPASYEHVISVTSVGPNNNHERFIGNPNSTHQHNNKVDISAPGYDIVLSTSPGQYVTGNGSSFATPLVSGTVALMLSVNPCLTPDQIEYILKETADSSIYEVNQNYIGMLGSGKLDSYKAVLMAKKFNTIEGELITDVNCVDSKRQAKFNNITGQVPLSFEWSNGSTNDKIEVDSTGFYSIEVKDVKGCKFYSEREIESYSEITTQSEINHVTCYGFENGGISVSTQGGDSTLTYEWSNGNTLSTMTNLKPGYYQVNVTDQSGCVVMEDFTINEPELLVTSLNYVQPTQNTFGSIDLDVVGGTKPYNYQWNHGEISEDLNSVVSDFYEVLVTDDNGCMSSENVILSNLTEEILNIGEIINTNEKLNPEIVLDMNGKQIRFDNAPVGFYFMVEGGVIKRIYKS